MFVERDDVSTLENAAGLSWDCSVSQAEGKDLQIL